MGSRRRSDTSGDLRVSLDRVFSRRVAPAVCGPDHAGARDIEELADCTHWFTTVIDGNRAALAALGNDDRSERSARRLRRPHQPSLVPIGPFTMRNLVMRLPLAGRVAPARPVAGVRCELPRPARR